MYRTRTLLVAAAATLFCGALAAQTEQQTQGEVVLASEQSPANELIGDVLRPTPPVQAQSMMPDTFAYFDFANGIDDWTFVNTMPDSVGLWEYETNPDLSADNGDTRYKPFDSETVDNGFMWLDYRKYLIDIGYVIGSPPYPNLMQAAISPVVDLSQLDLSSSYALTFYSYQSTLNIRNCRVLIRNADGTGNEVEIWRTFQEIARPNVASPQQEFAQIPSEFYGSSGVEFVFQYDADFYGWALDDIVVTQRPPNDGVITDFFARAPNVSTPASEASAYPLAFVADVLNNGGADQEMRLAITIADTGAVVLYTDTLDYASIMSDSTKENMVFPNTFPMPTEVGEYTGTYTLLTTLSEEDIAPNNNTQSFAFEVTEDLFSRSGDEDDGGVRPSANNEEYGSSNLYITPSLTNGDTVFIEQIAFRAVPRDFTDSDEGFLEARVYGWRGDLNGDGAPVFGDDPADAETELVELSLREYTIDATWGDSTIIAPPTEDEESIMLPFDEGYIGFAVALDYFPLDGGTNGDNRFFTGQVDFSGGAYTLATDSIGEPTLLSTLRVPSTPTLTYSYFTNRTPYLDALIRVSGDPVGVRTLSTQQFAISPNPTSDRLFIDLDIEEVTAGQATLLVRNAVGQTILNRTEQVAGIQRLSISTASFNQGLYYLELNTADGRKAVRKFMVQR